jgi:hypothetical protein
MYHEKTHRIGWKYCCIRDIIIAYSYCWRQTYVFPNNPLQFHLERYRILIYRIITDRITNGKNEVSI